MFILKKSIWNVLFAFLWNSTINHQKLPLTFDICDILVSQIWASAGVLAFFPHFLLASSKIQILVNYNDKKKSQEHFRLLSSIVFASFFKKVMIFPKKVSKQIYKLKFTAIILCVLIIDHIIVCKSKTNKKKAQINLIGWTNSNLQVKNYTSWLLIDNLLGHTLHILHCKSCV